VRISGYPNLEIVVVNDGSTDAISNAVFEAIVGVVKVRKANGGLSSARNAGIRAATGDYLLMLDADDKIHPDYIPTAVRALDNNPGLSYLSCHAQNFGVYTNPYLPVGFVPALMPYVNTDGKCANVYRREVFAACGGYDEIMVAYEDWDFLLTLHERGLEGDVLPSEFLFYRRHRDSMVFTVADPQRATLIQYMILKHRKLLEKHSQMMVVVLAGLWKQTEITAEKLAEKVATLSAALAQENAPVRTKEVVRMLKRYGRRKLGWLRPSGFRAG
jgi:glycosyltransferase involved in cell wall biosynthesis